MRLLYSSCRCGFLGLLHMDVFHQRLEQVIFPIFSFRKIFFLYLHVITVCIMDVGAWSSCHFHCSNCSLYFWVFWWKVHTMMAFFNLYLERNRLSEVGFEFWHVLCILILCSKVEVQNPAALFSDPKKRLTACWEPTVIATIIIPSE